MYRKYIKRIFDLVFAIIGLIILSPIFIISGILCVISFRGEIFFTQERIGKNEKVFLIIKFITMKPVTNENTIQRSEKHRITPIGNFLRRTSIDELPQLFNIIKGEMSFIGPRPLLVKYLPFYTPQERIRHTVLPGVTGLAQVMGRNQLNWDTRLQYDCEYVAQLSFKTDLKIFLKTSFRIFHAGQVTVDPRSAMADLDEERSSHHD